MSEIDVTAVIRPTTPDTIQCFLYIFQYDHAINRTPMDCFFVTFAVDGRDIVTYANVAMLKNNV